MRINPLTRFAKDESGAVAVIVSLLMTVLLGFVALGVDVASLYRERSQLQSISDLTAVSAMAAPDIATSRANYTISRNPSGTSALETLELGRYLRNPAIPPQDRFTVLPAGDAGVNAVRVVLEDDAPLYFAVIFSDDTHVTLDRTSLATRTGAASFSLNSHLLYANNIDLNRMLEDLFGVNAAISVAGLDRMESTSISLGDLLEVLDAATGGTSRNPAEILNSSTTIADLVAALQTLVPNGVATDLNGLATAAGTISVASLVGGIDTDLGLTATDFLANIDMSALDVVKAIIAAESSAAGFELDTDVTASGLVSAETTMTMGEPPAHSGWVAIGEEGVQLNRAAARINADITIEPSLLGNLGVGIEAVSVNVPIHVELAGSSASLVTVGCNTSSPLAVAAQFATSHSPLHPDNGTSVAALYLGTLPAGNAAVNPADLGFADVLVVDLKVNVLLTQIVIPGITIQARSHVNVGASQADNVIFTQDDVTNGNTVKTFGAGNLMSTAVADLLSPSNTEIRVKPGQGGLIAGAAAPLVSTLLAVLPDRLLTGLLTPVDAVLDGVLSGAGLELGAGELTLTGHHCEPITLVQ